MRYFTLLRLLAFGFMVLVLGVPVTAAATDHPDPLQQEVADAVGRLRHRGPDLLTDLARRNPRSIRYMEQYATDRDQTVTSCITTAAEAVHSDASIGLLSAVLPATGGWALDGLWSYECSRLRTIGGTTLRLNLERTLDTTDRAPLLLTCFKGDPSIAAKLKTARTATVAPGQSNSSPVAFDVALLALGDSEAKARLLKSIQQGDRPTVDVLAAENAVRLISDPDVLLEMVEWVKDKRGLIVEGNSNTEKVSVIERVCDSLLWQLAGKSGVDIGVAVHYDPFATCTPTHLYTDAQLSHAYGLLKAYYRHRVQQH